MFWVWKTKKTDLMREMPGTGINFQNWYFFEEYSNKFQWQNKWDTFEQMYNDSAVYRAYNATVVFSNLWNYEVERFDDDTKSQEIADFVKKAMREECNRTRRQLVSTIKRKLKDGNVVIEMWLRFDGKNYRPRLKYRRAENIEKREMSNGEPGIHFLAYTEDGIKYIDIPASKIMLFTYDQDGENYEGRSIFRRIGKDRYYKDKLEKYQMVKAERQSVPVIMVKTSPSASDEDVAKALENAQNVRSFEEGVLQEIVDNEGNPIISYEFMDTKANSTDTKLHDNINQYEQNIIDGFYASFLYLGKSSTGSYNQSDSSTDFFLKGVEIDTQDDLSVINKTLVKLLVDYNFGEQEWYPEIKLNALAEQDMNIFSQSMQRLSQAKLITPDVETEQEVRRIVGLKEKTEKNIKKDEENKAVMKKSTPTKDAPEKKEQTDTEKEFSDMLNNNILKKLYENTRARTMNDLQKKGLKFNEFESEAPRPLTFAERKVNLKSIKDKIDDSEKKVSDIFDKYTGVMQQETIDQVKQAIKNRNIQQIDNLSINQNITQEMENEFMEVYQDMFELWRTTASTELKIDQPAIDSTTRELMQTQNKSAVQHIKNTAIWVAWSTIKEMVAKRWGDIWQLNINETVSNTQDAMNRKIAKTKPAIVTPYTTGSINMGRETIVNENPEKVYAAQYSAVLDNRTTRRCASLDGRVVRVGSSEYYDYSPPQHLKCRSLRVYIWQDETFKPDVTGIPSSIPRKTDMYATEEMKDPEILKNSKAKELYAKKVEEGEVEPT